MRADGQDGKIGYFMNPNTTNCTFIATPPLVLAPNISPARLVGFLALRVVHQKSA
jgi:hypothetical protein